MSENERRAVKVIVMLDGLTLQGHFKIYTDDVKRHLIILYNLYNGREIGGKEYEVLKDEILAADYKIGTSGYDSNLSMMFAMLIELVEPFAKFAKGARGDAWRNFYEYARTNDLHKHLAKKVISQLEMENLEVGFEMAEIIKNKG